ncbi:M14 family metallopeptidase [Nostoc sp.]|uniref:M14 family metallopeptidase n=1 Tax=Nostoc sp. TaxID=1180 RepID=UPI002FF15F61
MDDISSWFSQDYVQAQERFRKTTHLLEHGAIEVSDGLTIDWAWSGNPQSPHVLVFSSGLHGIEGFAGSAAQLYLLSLNPEISTLWLHVLNPWGMANLRRVDSQNVDLNRNFLAESKEYQGVHPTYSLLDPLLNPPSPPTRDFFLLQVMGAVLQHGYENLKSAVVTGQYEYPQGLFFGGKSLQPALSRLLLFLDKTLSHRERIVHVDLHSGLGKFGELSLLLEGESNPGQIARAHRAFGSRLKSRYDRQGGYLVRGGFTHALAQRLQSVRYDGITCEFGTYNMLHVLAALRNENRLHHNAQRSFFVPSKPRLLEVFSPSNVTWRSQVLLHAITVYKQACVMLND